MTIPPDIAPRAAQATAATAARDKALMASAKALESSFLAEMLGHAGLGQVSESFGGGAGEEQFASFLRAAQADAIVAHGGIGLAEQIFNALKERADGQG